MISYRRPHLHFREPRSDAEFRDVLHSGHELHLGLQDQALCEEELVRGLQPGGHGSLVAHDEKGLHLEPVRRQALEP